MKLNLEEEWHAHIPQFIVYILIQGMYFSNFFFALPYRVINVIISFLLCIADAVDFTSVTSLI